MKLPTLLCLFLSCTRVVLAEITLDGTLAPHIALEGPDYAIGAEVGQQHGSNLFHSFETFNININESATFSGPDSINNVINRVTGGHPSHINGLFRSTIPNADVYFLNPYGIIFGKDAQLDVLGSFHASTADTLRFSDGSQFNARNQANSLLTVAPVSAFGFLTETPQPLSVEGIRFRTLPAGKIFSLIGGPIQMNEAIIDVTNGRINIAGVTNPGDVKLLPNNLGLSAPAGNVTLQNSVLSVSGGGDSNGGIYIRAGQFLVEDTVIYANTSTAADAGEINVQANDLKVTRGGQITSLTSGTGRGGQINLKIAGLTELSGYSVDSRGIKNKSQIDISSVGDGDGGSFELETGTLNLTNDAAITATAFGQGAGGGINIRATDSINLDGGTITATTYGQGPSGHINLIATNSIKLSGFDSLGQGSTILANTFGNMNNAGFGGKMNLETNELQLTDGASIGTNTYGTGQGGQIHIKATDSITLSGENNQGFTSSLSTVSAGSGEGGSIVLETNQLSLLEGTNIRADSGGTGQGGDLNLQVNDLVKLEGLDSAGYGSYITAQSVGKMENAGDGGTIELSVGRLQLADGAQIGASTFGSGQGGKLDIRVAQEAMFSGQDQSEDGYRSGLFTSSQSETDNAGDGGNIRLRTGELQLTANAEINASTWSTGQGGNVNIQAQTLKLIDGGTITTRSEAQGNAGQIELNLADKLIMRHGIVETKTESADGGNLVITTPSYVYLINSQITASVSEEFGGGGNVTVEPQFVVLDGSQIFAKAKKGKGGNIDLTTTGIYNFTGEPIETIINASSEFGIDGVVTISTPDTNAEESFLVLPNNFFDASALLDNNCQKLAENLSSFVVRHSNGAPSNSPGDLLASPLLLSKLADRKKTFSKMGKETQVSRHPVIALLTKCSLKSSSPVLKPK